MLLITRKRRGKRKDSDLSIVKDEGRGAHTGMVVVVVVNLPIWVVNEKWRKPKRRIFLATETCIDVIEVKTENQDISRGIYYLFPFAYV